MSLVRLRVQQADIVPLDDQIVNLLQAEVPAASAVMVAPVLVFSDFQCSRFVAVVFRHGVLLSKERPAVDAWNSLVLRPTCLFLSKTFNAIAKEGNAKAKNGETMAWEYVIIL